MMKPVGIYVTLVLALMLVLMSSTAAKEADPGSVQDRLPLAAGICINKARNLFQCHQVHKAIDLLETCISKGEKDSRHYYPYFVLGNYYLTLADGKDQLNNSRTVTQRAASCYQESVNLNPLFSPGWLNLAKCQYETQAFAGAAASFEQGYNTSRTPKSVHLYSAAVCHFKAKDFKKARDVFVRLMAAHPEAMSFSYKETFVHILFSLESYRQALPYIEELAKESRIEKKKQWEQILLQQYLFLKMDQKALAYAEFLVQTDTLEPRWWKALSHIYLSNDHIRQGLSALIIYGYLTPMT
ncbi:MAG: hypothetical protein KKE61_05560, partial [Proteobacteria bacterium]|nr:hypothetical protein [Pseudomonadota bacterium]